MAIIKSGVDSSQLTVDPTSKAARTTLYDAQGNILGTQKATYRAATANIVTTAASATTPIFVIYGSSTKTIKIQRINISGTTTATLAIQGFNLIKYSSAPSGGTATVLTQVPLDSNNSVGTVSLLQCYTAVPTTGTVIGAIGSVRILNKSTTAVDGSEMQKHTWDFRINGESTPIILRGTIQGVGLQLHVAVATSVSIEIEWTEET